MRRLVYIVIHGLSDGFYEIDSVWSDEKTANKVCDRLNAEIVKKKNMALAYMKSNNRLLNQEVAIKIS